ncbi:MAG TPA: hypothetical protein VFL60_10745 [Gaiellaceae bacterium]|nr:hypothetical protein [Gaiellaceae bacterium]
MNTRRHALALAALLAATVLTGMAAIFGLARTPAQQLTQQPAVAQVLQPAQQSPHDRGEGD